VVKDRYGGVDGFLVSAEANDSMKSVGVPNIYMAVILAGPAEA
jgi:hypothetical protein